MEEKDKDLSKKDTIKHQNGFGFWKPMIVFYAKTTSWIVLPLILAVFGGKFVTKTFQSQSIFFLFIIVGFLITCFGIYREIKKYKKGLEVSEKKEQDIDSI
ncbi:MAG TPA: hypothetical protein PKZ36_01900 [Candidatus Paceibacterota bacterium]|nr:hypothetical protein [Candidatus Paceibacterota bacterium]HPT18140.1 hypothetical protein [Candidatus Paceibacterota bacterium]